ncbi:iron-hydroxamate ABC transporter substrate-binding protein [Pullulanibacillus sp. KACC 23026]|uniref:iron-hydroxamate ABC transporter substrate-binding protein n=1 Tax=Pullulanibacillus sp. KACC 23026 TaxID=3028315 RepID=UPI0023AFEF6E|nr:iron-hydroxamate ABC transporter substrate-binding protein [Pullulanibacillus sp. KACC 23026]WEG12826.1 iron-hydroxamate ABC transporter substrate-binding protein [Pullulanibacillus sp. KACC 23026]
MPFLKKNLLFISMICLVMSFLAACGSSTGSKSDRSSSSNEKGTSTEQTLTDANGKVTLPTNPKRIIAPYLEDSLTALGVKPVAQWSIGDTVQNYLQSDLKGVPKIGWNLPLEQVMKYNPDLIIVSSPGTIQSGQLGDYQKIAPVYVFKDATYADWRQQLLTMGNILGKEDKAKKAISDYDKKAASDKAKIKKAIGDQTAAVIWVSGGKYYLFEQDRFSAKVLYEDLGVKAPKMVASLSKAKTQWNPISLEKLSELDADHIFLVGPKGDAGFSALDSSSVWNNLPAVKAGHVYTYNDPSNWTVNGIIASEKTMDDVTSALTK